MSGASPTWETKHRHGADVPVHRHTRAYAAFVLDGAYEEFSVDGRFLCEAGALVLHPAFHSHGNSFARSGATVLNLELEPGSCGALPYKVVRPTCFEELIGRIRHRPRAAALAVLEEARLPPLQPGSTPGWMGEMAALLRQDAWLGIRTEIAALSARLEISPQHASRAFREHYGVSPARYRTELRLRRGGELLSGGSSPSWAALEAGFADQSHFTRRMRGAYDCTPARYGAANSVQDRGGRSG
jgi:AraC-like DNA-binding protein